MLLYVAELHVQSIHPLRAPFAYLWEEIGPGYCYGPAFGHWDVVHAILDTLPTEPEHARQQIINNLAAQQEDGLMPGSTWMREQKPRWSTRTVPWTLQPPHTTAPAPSGSSTILTAATRKNWQESRTRSTMRRVASTWATTR